MEKRICAQTYTMGFDGEYIWFTHSYLNILYCVCLQDRTVKEYCIPTYESEYEVPYVPLYAALCIYGDEIWLIPCRAKKYIIFNTRLCKFNIYDFSEMKSPAGVTSYIDAIVYKGEIILFPYMDSYITKINVEKKDIKKVLDLKDIFEWNYGCLVNRYGKKCAVPFGGSCNIAIINFDNCGFIKMTIDVEKSNYYEPFAFIYENYMIVSSNGDNDNYIRKYDLNKKCTVAKIKKRENAESGKSLYSAIWELSSGYFIVDYSDIPIVDIFDINMKYIATIHNDVVYDKRIIYLGKAVSIDYNTFIYFDNVSGTISKYKILTDGIELLFSIPISISEGSIINIFNGILKHSENVHYETEVFSIDKYVLLLTEKHNI